MANFNIKSSIKWIHVCTWQWNAPPFNSIRIHANLVPFRKGKKLLFLLVLFLIFVILRLKKQNIFGWGKVIVLNRSFCDTWSMEKKKKKKAILSQFMQPISVQEKDLNNYYIFKYRIIRPTTAFKITLKATSYIVQN